MPIPIEPHDLVFHVLNVGFGDNILVEFPADVTGQRSYGLVDCCDSRKTKSYLKKLGRIRPGRSELVFICATHPHFDHISGIRSFLLDEVYRPKEFWDSGFRHNSQTYLRILDALLLEGIKMVRVSSGMEQYFCRVQVTVLAPSIALRNRYATYGVDMNNASIVLRFENHLEDVLLMKSREFKGKSSLEAEREAGRSVMILAGDAEFDSWTHVVHEFPRLERTSAHEPLIKKMVNYLGCSLIKVSHHGSMHSTPLDAYEKMSPERAVVSTEQKVSTTRAGRMELTRGLFPHPSSTIALEECGAWIATTDGSYESQTVDGGGQKDPEGAHPGSIVAVVPPGGKPRWIKLHDGKEDVPEPPTQV